MPEKFEYLQDQENFDRTNQEFEDIWFGEIGMCGCGNPEQVKELVLALMEIQIKQQKEDYADYDAFLKARADIVEKLGIDVVLEFIFHVLDHNELWAHGGYVGNGWITERGKTFIKGLKQNIEYHK